MLVSGCKDRNFLQMNEIKNTYSDLKKTKTELKKPVEIIRWLNFSEQAFCH